MEELRSTDILDKEIYADSQKKVERLLSQAKESADALLNGVEARVAEARENAKRASEARLSLYEKNVNASVPLEKERYLVSYIYGSVIDAMNSYFTEAGEKKRLSVIEALVKRAKLAIGKAKVSAKVVGLNLKDAESMLKGQFGSALLSCAEASPALIEDEKVAGLAFSEGVVLKTEDGHITCRLTLDEKIKEILEEKSQELSVALFGGRMPE